MRRAYGACGLFGTLFGVAGWQDDAHTWAEWAKVNPELTGALMGAGGVMMVTYLAWEVSGLVKRRRGEQATTPTVVHFHGDIGTVNVGADGLYRAPFEGQGEIISPVPIEAKLRPLQARATVSRAVATSGDKPDSKMREGT